MKRIVVVCVVVFTLIVSWSIVSAEDFYVIPVKGKYTSWDTKLSGSTRFKLVLDAQAVLDRETGLVWEKNPDATTRIWANACSHCYKREVANRKGWRLPTIEELASLVDNDNVDPALPPGHLFPDAKSSYYWSSSTDAGNTSYAWGVNFYSGNVYSHGEGINYYAWCVRGGYGHDAY